MHLYDKIKLPSRSALIRYALKSSYYRLKTVAYLERAKGKGLGDRNPPMGSSGKALVRDLVGEAKSPRS